MQPRAATAEGQQRPLEGYTVTSTASPTTQLRNYSQQQQHTRRSTPHARVSAFSLTYHLSDHQLPTSLSKHATSIRPSNPSTHSRLSLRPTSPHQLGQAVSWLSACCCSAAISSRYLRLRQAAEETAKSTFSLSKSNARTIFAAPMIAVHGIQAQYQTPFLGLSSSRLPASDYVAENSPPGTGKSFGPGGALAGSVCCVPMSALRCTLQSALSTPPPGLGMHNWLLSQCCTVTIKQFTLKLHA
ncbi:hypothetical protein F5884DRAFT_849377 [Xylogone sp. PMI_703]|nr:hypothetical protein F5884DRAFT_849377 [Xylogone sp. PMI_703]